MTHTAAAAPRPLLAPRPTAPAQAVRSLRGCSRRGAPADRPLRATAPVAPARTSSGTQQASSQNHELALHAQLRPPATCPRLLPRLRAADVRRHPRPPQHGPPVRRITAGPERQAPLHPHPLGPIPGPRPHAPPPRLCSAASAASLMSLHSACASSCILRTAGIPRPTSPPPGPVATPFPAHCDLPETVSSLLDLEAQGLSGPPPSNTSKSARPLSMPPHFEAGSSPDRRRHQSCWRGASRPTSAAWPAR